MLSGSVIRLLITLFALLLWHRWVGEIRQRSVPKVMIEPGEVVLHDGAHRPGLGNRMAEAFVDDHLDAYAFVLQRLSQLIGVGDGHATIKFAMLNECRCARVLDVGNWRGLLIDHRIVHRILA